MLLSVGRRVCRKCSDRGTWSEAQYDRHAFIYQADVNGVDRFTIPVGRIVPPQVSADQWIERNRAFIHDDTVFYVQDEVVWSAFWIAPTIVNGPF